MICNCVTPDPETCAACRVDDVAPPAFELAKLLAHKLARISNADAYVINDDGHAMLACHDDIGVYWQPSQIIFRAPAPEA